MLERNELTSTLNRLKNQLHEIEQSLRQPLTLEHLEKIQKQVHYYQDLIVEAEEKLHLLDSA